MSTGLQDREVQGECETAKVALFARVSDGYCFHILPAPKVKSSRINRYAGYTLWRFVKVMNRCRN